jgi:hypothetical protein
MTNLEAPKLDARLHKLMLMHRWIEEARALGYDEPHLEFRDDQSRLTMRGRGANVTEEVGFEDVVSGDLLRGLRADGYVDLDYGGSELGAAVVTVTEKGLEKIKHRRAFESNLPRFCRKWDASLLGSLKRLGLSEEWKANWEGHLITVRNHRYVLLRGRSHKATFLDEYLYLDHQPPPKYRVVRSRFSKDLYGELRTADGRREVHAHVGLVTPLLQTGCLIAVDGVAIGGDLVKRRRFLT